MTEGYDPTMRGASWPKDLPPPPALTAPMDTTTAHGSGPRTGAPGAGSALRWPRPGRAPFWSWEWGAGAIERNLKLMAKMEEDDMEEREAKRKLLAKQEQRLKGVR